MLFYIVIHSVASYFWEDTLLVQICLQFDFCNLFCFVCKMKKNVNCQSAKLPVVAIQGHLEHPPLYLLCYLLLVNCIEGLLLDFIKLVFASH